MEAAMDMIIEGKNRLVNNSIKSFEGMTTQRWIRLVAIIGAYVLIRPYLLSAAANHQKRALEKEAEELGLGPGTTANHLRGGKKAAPAKAKNSSSEKNTGGGKVLWEVKED